jgi:hypothetical protein
MPRAHPRRRNYRHMLNLPWEREHQTPHSTDLQHNTRTRMYMLHDNALNFTRLFFLRPRGSHYEYIGRHTALTPSEYHITNSKLPMRCNISASHSGAAVDSVLCTVMLYTYTLASRSLQLNNHGAAKTSEIHWYNVTFQKT